MQQVYAYYGISRWECEMMLAELVERGFEILQFQIVNDNSMFSLFVLVRAHPDGFEVGLSDFLVRHNNGDN